MEHPSLLTGENAAFLEQQYLTWLEDPASVDAQWRDLFGSWERPGNGRSPRGPSFRPRSIFNPGGAFPGVGASPAEMAKAHLQAKVAQLINSYRVRGHMLADIDPLDQLERTRHPELTLEYYGLTEADLDVPVSGGPLFGVPAVTTLRHIIARLEAAYCGKVGAEYMNIADLEQKRWIQEHLETLQDTTVLTRDEELHVLRKMSDAEGFEAFLQMKFPGTKRFSAEGAETLIPLLDFTIERLASHGIKEVIFGMAHRGRLNVLANILRKPVDLIIREFEDNQVAPGSGDVKYHLGYSTHHQSESGGKVYLSLSFNPSHLEAVDPVVEGRARARLDRRYTLDAHKKVCPVLIHGDAAFAGQGLVTETLNLSELSGYRTGGTIHIIVNNQIGFTTRPKDARSTPYSTDVARMLAVPIFHVNGENPEAVAAVVKIAVAWRMKFGRDVVIDMYCFRKHGHNEGDEPSFTQPLMYDAIRNHPSPREVYARRMVESGALTREDVDRIFGESRERLEKMISESSKGWTSYEGNPNSKAAEIWAPYKKGSVHDPVDTTVDRTWLEGLLVKANTLPPGFHAHKKIERLLAQRLQRATGEIPLDWAMGEQAAFATLVAQGHHVRLSGQDSGRGTFSHRHAALTDVETGQELYPLQHLDPQQGRFRAIDSPLSEAAVLGFEYGYGLEYPETLVIWEAQFGDFANGAQVIIDNFILSGEQKWSRMSGVVMLLPHGYEGQGPEHSSARLERYLQSCAEDNLIVANVTTPANFFHLLRRQVLMKTRKPLVVMAPKSLLRHPRCLSTLDELASGTFQHVIGDAQVEAARVKRVVLCSGKVYYDLLEERERRAEERVALVRVEQLYPVPEARIQEELARFPGAEIVWCQEEPRNMGPWPMMDEWLHDLLGMRPHYAGRARAASPAAGSHKVHEQQLHALLDAALTVP